MDRALRERGQNGSFDLEALEFAVRDSLHRLGGSFLEQFLNTEWQDTVGCVRCKQQHASRPAGKREKKLLTVLGEIRLERDYFHCAPCQEGRIPKDEE